MRVKKERVHVDVCCKATFFIERRETKFDLIKSEWSCLSEYGTDKNSGINEVIEYLFSKHTQILFEIVPKLLIDPHKWDSWIM